MPEMNTKTKYIFLVINHNITRGRLTDLAVNLGSADADHGEEPLSLPLHSSLAVSVLWHVAWPSLCTVPIP